MNFDDIRSSYLSLSFEGGDSASIDFTRRVEGAVEKVQKEDRRDRRMLMVAMVMFTGLALVYSMLAVREYVENPQGSSYFGFALYTLGIITFLPLIVYKYRRSRRVSYDVPVLQFIGEVEKRYAPLQPIQLFAIPFVVLADVALVYMHAGSGIPTFHESLEMQILFIASLTVGLAIGVGLWYTRKLPILVELRRIKKSIE